MNILTDYIVIINIIFLIIIVFFERKRPMFTLFWIILLILAPYIGFIIYLYLGLSFRKLRKVNKGYQKKFNYCKKTVHQNSKNSTIKWKELIGYVEMSCKNTVTTNNDIDIYIKGEEFFDKMYDDIKNATQCIYMEYYIFRNDDLGKRFSKLLIEKAKLGVKIKLIIDAGGGCSKSQIKEMEKYGIEVGLFFPSMIPLLPSLRVNYRDHRKLTLIDNKIGYIGGFNIGDEYLGKGKLGEWRDTGVRVVGNTIFQLEKEFFFSWKIVKKKNSAISVKNMYNKENKYVKPNGNKAIQIVSGGPNYQFRTMRDNFLKMIISAKKSILIQTPYFIPDETIIDALKLAVLSGVEVKIIVPDKPDHMFVYWVNQKFLSELVSIGTKIYRYNKGFIHSKFMIIDDELVSVGSANFDYRSFYHNFEININIYDKDIAMDFVKIYNEDIENSTLIGVEEFEKRGYIIKMKEAIFSLLAPLM